MEIRNERNILIPHKQLQLELKANA